MLYLHKKILCHTQYRKYQISQIALVSEFTLLQRSLTQSLHVLHVKTHLVCSYTCILQTLIQVFLPLRISTTKTRQSLKSYPYIYTSSILSTNCNALGETCFVHHNIPNTLIVKLIFHRFSIRKVETSDLIFTDFFKWIQKVQDLDRQKATNVIPWCCFSPIQ